MSYRTIAVHVDASRHAPKRIQVAARLARDHDAHLIGVAALGVSREIFPHGYQAAPGSLEASYFDPLHAKAMWSLERFAEAAGAAGVAFEKRLVADLASEALARAGRFADLVVVSQDDPSEARPTGLPLMRRAVRTTVVAFRPRGDCDLGEAAHQAALVAFLSRHEVQADIMVLDRDIDGGEALLTLAVQEAYDLLVIGCYGHSQFRELILGGVTRKVLQDATLSVLMAR